jgi:hypothetical protein
VGGTSFAEFSRRHIFEPLGMTRTQWRDDYTRIVPGRSAAYAVGGDGFSIDRPIENVHGNGGLLTTVGDLLTWNRALATGRFGGPGFLDMLYERGVLNDGSQIEYAAGINVTSYNGVPERVHTGATSGYRAFLAHYPDQSLDVALLCNVGAVNPGAAGHLVADVFLGGAARPGTSPATTAAPAEARPDPFEPTAAELQQYAGEYYSPDADATFNIAVEDGRLVLHRRAAQRVVLTPASRDEFVGPGRIRFVRDSAGAVVQLSVQQPRVYDLRFDRVRR